LHGYLAVAKHMSEYFRIMNDRQTRLDAGSPALAELLGVSRFFMDWRTEVMGIPLPKSVRNSMFLTSEAYEDLQSSIHGFVGCVRYYYTLERCSGAYTVARRWSQDKVENKFSFYKENTPKLEHGAVSTKAQHSATVKVHRPEQGQKRRRSYRTDPDKEDEEEKVLPLKKLQRAKADRAERTQREVHIWGQAGDDSRRISRTSTG
jgi:hypothetical protein